MREMNGGHVLQSSPVQQMMAAGNPNWWSINNMRPPPLTFQRPSPFLPPTVLFPPFTPSPNSSSSSSSSSTSNSLPSMASWQNNQDQLQESWSQLLLGGLVGGEEDKSSMGHFQGKKMGNWEDQALQSGPIMDVKQENVATSYMYAHANQDFHHQIASKPSTWSQIMPPTNSSIGNSSNSCVTTTNMLDFSSANKGDPRHPPPDRSSECNSSGSGGAVKKARVQASCSNQSNFKVRKEKLGDRITALHQLVSPFGKTDTASVLLEAIGYIRFLQTQIEALSLPYLANDSQNMRQQQQHAVNQGERNCIFPEETGQDSMEEPKKDLRSRGLCLVPLSCTMQVSNENGADYWAAAAFGGGFR